MKKMLIVLFLVFSFIFAPCMVQAEENTSIEFGISEEGKTPSIYKDAYEELESELANPSENVNQGLFSSVEKSTQVSMVILIVFTSFVATSFLIYQFILKKEQ